MLVYLIGFMGSGKTTVGKKLSGSLGKKFLDLDKAIEEREGRSVHEIFAARGEEYFRKVESEVVRSIQPGSDMIIACGGGTPCYNDNMEYMNKSGLTVYLEMSAKALAGRLAGSSGKRPLISGMNRYELEEYINETLKKRELWYGQAKFTVSGLDTDITQLSSLLRAQAP